MDRPIDDMMIEQEVPVLSVQEVFTKIWFSPREVHTFIKHHKFNKYEIRLIVLYAIAVSLSFVSNEHPSDEGSAYFSIGKVGGTLALLAGFYFYSLLVRIVGSWFGGNARSSDITNSMAYSVFPVVLTLPLYIISYFIDSSGTINEIIQSAIQLAVIVLSLWSFILVLVGVSVRHEFSYWKAFTSMLIATIIFALLPLTGTFLFFG